MHLMFLPPVPGPAIWVPLRKLSWNWYGDAVLSYSLDGYFLNGAGGTVGTDMDSTTHPVWTSNIYDGIDQADDYIPE